MGFKSDVNGFWIFNTHDVMSILNIHELTLEFNRVLFTDIGYFEYLWQVLSGLKRKIVQKSTAFLLFIFLGGNWR